MSIKPDRLESVDFTEPYFDAGLIIAVRNNNDTIKSTEDLKGKKLAAQNGTTGAAYCDSVKEKDPKTVVRIFDDIGAAFMELEKGGSTLWSMIASNRLVPEGKRKYQCQDGGESLLQMNNTESQ